MNFARLDFESGVWMRLRAYLKERLADQQLKLETSLDPVKTAEVRGCIRELKNLLALEQAPAQGTPSD